MRKVYFSLVEGMLLLFIAMTLAWADSVVIEFPYQKTTTLSYPAVYTLRFSLWDTESGGTTWLWFEEKEVTLNGPKIKTYLGDSYPLDGVDFSKQLWVQVEKKRIDGTYKTLPGRDMLRTTPYAIWAMTPAGPEGPQGPTGPTGPQGPQGPMGPEGPQGPQGVPGPSGGASVLNGTSDPIDSIGVDGDFFINTTTNTIFGPKTAGAWGAGTSLIGPEGSTGAQGPAGSEGPQGPTGAQGPAGPEGPQGSVGPTGPQGLEGPAGPTGAQGPAGPEGPQGPAGPTSIAAIGTFYGAAGTIVGGSSSWVFVGPTTALTTTAGQRMTGAAQAALGTNTQSAVAFGYDLCYRPTGTTNPLVNFSGSNYTRGSINAKSGRVSFAATSSVIPGAGSWDVGYCARNTSANNLNNNSNVNGWVMVTN